jgi:hypothetical protein
MVQFLSVRKITNAQISEFSTFVSKKSTNKNVRQIIYTARQPNDIGNATNVFNNNAFFTFNHY